MENVATPAFDTPTVLLLIAVMAIATGIHLFKRINTRYWGANRGLYLLSGGNQAVGDFLAPLPGVASIGLGIWALGRALGFF